MINKIRQQRMKMVQTVVGGVCMHHWEMSWCIGFQPFRKPIPTLHALPSSIFLYPSLFPYPLSNLPCTCTCTSYTSTQMDVHTQDQYIFIHDAILESVMCGDTQINASEFKAALHTLKSRTQSGETGFEHQFGVSCVSMQHS